MRPPPRVPAVRRARKVVTALRSAAVLALALAAGAGAEPTRPAAVVSVGAFDAEAAARRAFEVGVQLRWPAGLGRLQPLLGASTTAAGSFNAYAGLSLDVPLGARASLRASFAPGYYAPGRSGRDLGYPLEFRSGLELAARLPGGWRVGLELYHLSNAGLGRINPGEESLVLTLAIPFGTSRGGASGASSR